MHGRNYYAKKSKIFCLLLFNCKLKKNQQCKKKTLIVSFCQLKYLSNNVLQVYLLFIGKLQLIVNQRKKQKKSFSHRKTQSDGQTK